MMVLKKLLSRLPLTFKMLVLVGVVGLFVVFVNDRYVDQVVKKMFEIHLDGMLQRQSQEDRLRFDRYISLFRQVVVLTGMQQKFVDYLDQQQWFQEPGDGPVEFRRTPEWFLSRTTLRALVVPRFAILLDSEGRAREIYARSGMVKPFMRQPSQLLLEKSYGQIYLAMVDGAPYMLSAEKISKPDGRLVTLFLVSPVDDEMLVATQADFPQRLIGLISADGLSVITSSNTTKIPPGAKLADLEKQFVITGREYHDYGDAEMLVRISSFVPTNEIDGMVRHFINRERIERIFTSMIFIFAFTLVLLWLTRRIRRLTLKVDAFSREALGTAAAPLPVGDKLIILEERFHRLTDEVISAQQVIQREAEEGAIRQLEMERKERQLELLQSVTRGLKLGVLICGSDECRPGNEQMADYAERFGDLAQFDINVGASEERRVVDNQGNEHFFRLTSPEYLFDQKVILASEITEQKKNATEKKKLERELIQAQRMESVGRLAGGVAHDFNNLLTAINGYAELTRLKMSDDEPLRDYIDLICEAGERAANLTSQLLAFSRKQVIAPEALDLNKVTSDLVRMLNRLIGENIEVVVKQCQGAWQVYMDRTQMEQILMNLAVNARDAMPAGGKLVVELENVVMDAAYAAAHPGSVPGEYVRLSVSDSGHGIKSDDLEHIFEPFFTTKEIGKGTGLGLATVYGIVKQNKGTIYVYSEPGHGTTFKLFFPRLTEEKKEVIADISSLALPQGTETIMLVEDEEQVRTLVVTVLSELGYTVLEAVNGRNALDLFEKYHGKIHLLLTDVVMPEMSGTELAALVTKKFPAVNVIYMSGYSENAIVQQGIVQDDVVFLQKPFTPQILAHAVHEVLAGRPA